MKSVFTVAHRGTFGEFMGLYRVGDEKRVRWGKSLFIEAISNIALRSATPCASSS